MFGRSRLRKNKNRTRAAWLIWFRRLWLSLLIVAPLLLLVYGAWYLSRLPSLTINKIEVSGGETVPHQEVEKTVNEQLSGSYYRFLPKRFVWLYPEEAIVAGVKALPRVKDVTLERTGGQTLNVTFTEYRPFALWCGQVAPGSLGQCLFIDREGKAFAVAPPLSGSAFLRYVDSEKAPKLAEQIFTQNWLALGEQLAIGLGQRFGFMASYIERVNEAEIFAHLSGGGVIKISAEQSALTTLDNLEAVLADKQFSRLRSGDFLYIDLRYGNKVFVKESEVVPEQAAAEPGTDETMAE